MPSAYYHFTKGEPGGDVEIFALDTNKQLFGMDSAQKTDVQAWIAQSKATWKIAVGHHPYLSNGPHGNAGKYDGIPIPPISGKSVKTFMDDVVCGKTDLYLSGHDHSRQWLNASCKGTELAVSGAGAKTTELPGSNPVLFESLALGFLYVVVEGKKLTCQFVDENGVVEFTHVITKP
jgi:tartrate-resistant acid phosphatase type 5